MNFKVGDRVYIVNGGYSDSYTEATVVSISPKRGDIKVLNTSSKEEVFNSSGWIKGRDIWNKRRLVEKTLELDAKVFVISNTRYVKTLLDSFVKQQEVDIEDILMLRQVIISTNWYKKRKVE